MIKQAELNEYAQAKRAFETAEKNFKALKETMAGRVLNENEEAEAGLLGITVKQIEKVNTKYKEVLEKIQNDLTEEQQEKLAEYLTESTSTSSFPKVDVFEQEEVVVTTVKKRKIA
jgi:hypothetical protein